MSAPLLIEIGCEELPARALVEQARKLADGIGRQLSESGFLETDQIRWLATPRRLALIAESVRARQPDRKLQRKGPPESAAFDDSGNPTPAAFGFARSVGLDVAELERLETPQGRWLYAELDQPGQALGEMLTDMLQSVIGELAGARSMRWSDRSERFLRPVRWLVVLHGANVVPMQLFGLESGRATRGHRVHAPGPHPIGDPGEYEAVLRRAFVLADFDKRRDRIRQQVEQCAGSVGLVARDDPALLDEVTGLVEWPVAVVGQFAQAFLEVPAEALISAMRAHQKSFPLFDQSGALAAQFISVANLESAQPKAMIRGFERVIRPRLADARFFYQQDRQKPLESRLQRLDEMLFQQRLGSLADKTVRLERLVAELAPDFGADAQVCARAARLCKCDLMTEMVGEFPELQGTMGRYYALADGEPEPVATAIESHYLPRHAGDALPSDPAGQALAVADRLDTLVGVFAAGKKPKGGKDPFALRRAALAVVRILEHSRCAVPVPELLQRAAEVVGNRLRVDPDVLGALVQFIDERLRSHLSEQGVATNTVNAVTAGSAGSVADFVDRARAVQRFADDPEVASLIAANKRAANLLAQAENHEFDEVDESSLQIEEERVLFKDVIDAKKSLESLLAERDYPAALARLAALRPAVDRFFDEVMVMAEDPALRRNRLSLLALVRATFLQIADVAKLGRA